MIRHYVSRRIGTGIPGTNNPFRCETYDWLRINFPGQHNPVSGYVGRVCTWTIMSYDLTLVAHAALLAAVTNTYAMPEVPVTSTLNDLTALQQNELITKFDTAGFDMAWTNPATTIREILDYTINSCQMADWIDVQIGNKAFDVRRKRMGDLTAPQQAEIQNRAALFGANMAGINAASPLELVAQRIKAVSLSDGKPPLSANSAIVMSNRNG